MTVDQFAERIARVVRLVVHRSRAAALAGTDA